MDDSVGCAAADSCTDGESVNLSVLNWEQVQRLDTILAGSIPIHGRWSFPTLEVKPRDIVNVVRSRMEEKRIHVREVRLNGSAASYVLHEDSGLGWKDLDLIFCADLKGEMEFQIVKDIVLDSLLDFLPEGVNKEKITPVTLKVAYGVIDQYIPISRSSGRCMCVFTVHETEQHRIRTSEVKSKCFNASQIYLTFINSCECKRLVCCWGEMSWAGLVCKTRVYWPGLTTVTASFNVDVRMCKTPRGASLFHNSLLQRFCSEAFWIS